MKHIALFSVLFLALNSFAAEAPKAEAPNLEDELKQLSLPDNVAPAGISKEAFYAVQNRYSDLRNRFEIEMGGAHNFRGSSYLSANQIDFNARYHINNKWSVSSGISYGFNEFTNDAKNLFQREGLIPDVAYVKGRANLLLGYHPFYGKFRISMDEVLYFDQYIAAGPGIISTQFSDYIGGVVKLGFVFWFGKQWSARVGLDNQIYNEKRANESSLTYHALGQLSLGYLFGGGES